MKLNALKIVALVLVLLMAITSCAPLNSTQPETTEGITTEEATTEEATTEEATTEEAITEEETTEEAATEEVITEEATTEEVTTEEVITEEATTEEVITEEATTEEATTEVVTTEEVTTEEPQTEVRKPKNILMIGNSACYYYVDELYAIARADGYDLTIANLYKSGAYISEHYNSYQSGEDIGELYAIVNKRRKNMGIYSVEEALGYAKKNLGADWDVITLQQNSSHAMTGDYEGLKEDTVPYAKGLYDAIKNAHPTATLYWHQTWSYEVGYDANPNDKNSPYKIQSSQECTDMHNLIKRLAYEIAEENGVNIVPVGDAWEIARRNAVIGTTLCARTNINNNLGDYLHDGDIGGGQYLNACVWYEVLMRESCVGNTWRPTSYKLSDEKIAILQAAAHEAVAAVYGADYAK